MAASPETIQQSLATLTKTKDGISQIVSWGHSNLKNPQHCNAITEKTKEYLDNATSTVSNSILNVGMLLTHYLDAQSAELQQLGVRVAVLGASLAQCESSAARAYHQSQRAQRLGFHARHRAQHMPLSGPRLPPAAQIPGKFSHEPPNLHLLDRFEQGVLPFKAPALGLDDPTLPPATVIPPAFPATYDPLADAAQLESPALGPHASPPPAAEMKLDHPQQQQQQQRSPPQSPPLPPQSPPQSPPLRVVDADEQEHLGLASIGPPSEDFYVPPPDDDFFAAPPPEDDFYASPPPP